MLVLTRPRVYLTSHRYMTKFCWKPYPEWCQLTQGYNPESTIRHTDIQHNPAVSCVIAGRHCQLCYCRCYELCYCRCFQLGYCRCCHSPEPALPPCIHSRNSSTAGHTCRDTSSDVCPSYAAPFLSTCEPLWPIAWQQRMREVITHSKENHSPSWKVTDQALSEPKHNKTEKKESGKTAIPYCHSYCAMIPVHPQNSFWTVKPHAPMQISVMQSRQQVTSGP